MDNLRQALDGWHHWMPFAALFAKQAAPHNRPMTTRLIEQILVAVVAGGGSAYGVNNSIQAVHDAEIRSLQDQMASSNASLQRQMEQSEARLTAQIMELRARQLK